MKRSAALILVAVLCAGCSTINKRMESWVGHHQSDLIRSWGPPQRTASDGKGGSILIYEQYVNMGQKPGIIQPANPLSVFPAGQPALQYTAPQQRGYNRTRMFYVNPSGRIYTYRWQGL